METQPQFHLWVSYSIFHSFIASYIFLIPNSKFNLLFVSRFVAQSSLFLSSSPLFLFFFFFCLLNLHFLRLGNSECDGGGTILCHLRSFKSPSLVYFHNLLLVIVPLIHYQIPFFYFKKKNNREISLMITVRDTNVKVCLAILPNTLADLLRYAKQIFLTILAKITMSSTKLQISLAI